MTPALDIDLVSLGAPLVRVDTPVPGLASKGSDKTILSRDEVGVLLSQLNPSPASEGRSSIQRLEGAPQ